MSKQEQNGSAGHCPSGNRPADSPSGPRDLLFPLADLAPPSEVKVDKDESGSDEARAGLFQLEFSAAAAPPRRRSRGKQGRDPVASKYRMAWVLVFFDLPVGTPEERKAAANFRKDLLREGYFMVQFSVYARPCGSADRVETQVRRLRPMIPPKGEVRSLVISDAQWGRMLVMRSQKKAGSEKPPEQLVFL